MGKSLRKTFGEKVSNFLLNLNPGFDLPKDFEFLLPYSDPKVKLVTRAFYRKFYSDDRKRVFMIGINPGRFGAGTTGIAFTDPVRLETECGIKNSFAKKQELSSQFIYRFISDFGGTDKFYSQIFLTAICPIGFIRHGKNINYYDDKKLLVSCREFIIETMKQQVAIGANRNTAICLGEGKNYTYLSRLNDEIQLFDEIIPLAHPRFIMQYKRKKIGQYLDMYIETVNKAVQKTSHLT